MRKLIISAVFLALMLAPAAAFAEIKIGVINFEGIVTSSEYGKSAKAQMQEKIKAAEASLKKDQEELEKMQQELSKQSMALTQEAQKDKIGTYREKAVAYEKKRRDSQEQLVKAENDIFKPVLELLVKVVQEYGQKNGYDMILNSKGSVVYTVPNYDLTKEILTEFDKAHKKK